MCDDKGELSDPGRTIEDHLKNQDLEEKSKKGETSSMYRDAQIGISGTVAKKTKASNLPIGIRKKERIDCQLYGHCRLISIINGCQ